MTTDLLSNDFRAFSARIGKDPLMIQGPGGNTSIKDDAVMWIKASGMELADAQTDDIFVAVDLNAARAEAHGAGDGTCKATVIDPAISLRPSIETTFHAALNWPVVAHSHSVATIVHVTSIEGRKGAADKLADMSPVFVPYEKPGVPLTGAILERIDDRTRVILLENHGLICCGETVADTEAIMLSVEERLTLGAADIDVSTPDEPPLEGCEWAVEEGWMARDDRVCGLIESGSYYPDHVVFLGPGIRQSAGAEVSPAHLVRGTGIQIRTDATPAQRAMLKCLSDVMRRIKPEWQPIPIGPEAEAELLNWDAEKYRQALADRT